MHQRAKEAYPLERAQQFVADSLPETKLEGAASAPVGAQDASLHPENCVLPALHENVIQMNCAISNSLAGAVAEHLDPGPARGRPKHFSFESTAVYPGKDALMQGEQLIAQALTRCILERFRIEDFR